MNPTARRVASLVPGSHTSLATFDARSQTAYGTLRAYGQLGQNMTNTSYPAGGAPRAFTQWAGFTAGLTDSFFDFFSFSAYSNQTNVLTSDEGGGGIEVGQLGEVPGSPQAG